MNTYSQYQNQVSSEKLTLAIMEASKRLIAFTLHSGSVYKILNFNVAVISSIQDSGVELSEVTSLAAVTAGKFYNDRDNQTLYLRTSDSVDPNSKFIHLTFKLFFSNIAINLPHNLSSGFDVYFEPQIQSTSPFQVEIDLVNEETAAIEGKGDLKLFNDQSFWPANFDKLFFDNQQCLIYSYNRQLPVTEAKLLFRGRVESKTYGSDFISFRLKDLMSELRNSINLDNVQDLGLRNDPALNTAKQRAVYGRLIGHRPINLDELINTSYPVAGTISVFSGSTSLVGTSTSFLSKLSKGDKLIISGVQYTIASIASDTALELTRAYAAANAGNLSVEVVPATNKSYMNREWSLAGHPLRQPEFTIEHGSSTSRLVVSSTSDLYDGDDIYIGTLGSGELVRIDQVINATIITLAQSTTLIYPAGTPVHKPCVQNLRMNDLELVYETDYNVDPNSARLTLLETAEENRAPLLESSERITVTNGNDYFEGAGTSFTTYIKPGDKVRPQSTDTFYKVLNVDSDTRITLTEPYVGTSFTSSVALAEKTAISGLETFRERYTFFAVGGLDLQGKYFKIWDDEGSVAVWFDIGNIGTVEPVHGCDRAIEITTVESGDADTTICKKIAQKLNLDDKFTASVVAATLTIENKTMGVRPAAKTSDTGFTVFSRSTTEQRVLCVADVADSLDGKFFTLFDGSGTVAFWIDTDNSGTLEPNHGCDRSVEITTIVTDDSVATVITKVKAVVEADSAFTTSTWSTTGFIATCTMIGPSIGTMPTGFTLNVAQSGKSAWWLNGKYFVLPHHYAGTDRTAGFWFDIDNNGTSAPSTGATGDTEINTVETENSESEIMNVMSDVINAHTNFTATYTANSILVTDAATEDVSTALSAGTSGLTLSQVQAGLTTNPLAGRPLQYKNYVFGKGDVLSCDILGKTVDGLTDSRMLKYAPEIVRDLLVDSGLETSINEASFTDALNYFPEEMAFAIPTKYNDKNVNLTYRDIINDVNKSVFGLLIQNADFELEYSSLRPVADASRPKFYESDILSFSVDSTNKNMIKSAIVNYNQIEYDYSSKAPLYSSCTKTSDISNYIVKTSKDRIFESYCTSLPDAQRLADRWSFLLEYSSNSVTFTTKLQGITLQINDVIEIEHRKMYERFSGASPKKIMLVERIGKKGDMVEITAIDLSNAFNRVAFISDTTTTWVNSNEQTQIYSGFITDDNGLIDNDESSFGTNLIY